MPAISSGLSTTSFMSGYFIPHFSLRLTASNRLYDFDSVALAEQLLLKLAPGHDLPVQFDGDAPLSNLQLLQKLLQTRIVIKFSLIAIDGDVHSPISSVDSGLRYQTRTVSPKLPGKSCHQSER